MSNRPGGKAPMGMTPKSAVAKAKPRSGGRFTPTGGKHITAASASGGAAGSPLNPSSTGGPSSAARSARSSHGGKSNISQYYNNAKPSSETRVRKPLPSGLPATPTKGGGQQRQYTGGKFVPGYSPQGFGSGPRATYEDSDEEEEDDDEEEEAEVQPEAVYDDDDAEDEYDEYGVKIKKEMKLGEADSDFQPDEEFEDVAEDEDLGIASIEDFVPARGRGGNRGRGGMVVQGSCTERGSYSATRVTYKKKIRKDSSRFTTTTAMIDADDEFHPKVAAFMGRKIVGTGNGRSAGRKLIRWTPATDQLLLLCFHHELAMNCDDLPYQEVAERMFPEKCATGGAVKERFAKLRIEMLNRGSWVPPIIGKSPQGIRPNVRGVVRVAPGVDKGRYVLWKEDASKLIDPKDIQKGYSAAQARGLDYPGRVWISNEAKEEFYNKKRELEQRGLKPLAAPPREDGEDEEVAEDASGSDRRASIEEEPEQYDEDMEEEEAVAPKPLAATPGRKRKMLGAPTPAAKRSAVAKSCGQSARKAAPVEDDDVFGPGDGSPKPRQIRRTPQKARPMAPPRSSAPSPEANIRGGDTGSNMMSFDPEEKTVASRRVIILTHVPSRVLANFPGGQHGTGSDKYYLDEVVDMVWTGKKNADSEEDAVVDAIKIDKDLPLDDPNHVLFNSGIVPPSTDPFWRADMEIQDLMELADKIVAEETRPEDMITQVFDGQDFHSVDKMIEEYKANTNLENGLPKDTNVWYRCATILRHATQGEQYESAKTAKANPALAQQNAEFQDFNMYPEQNAMIDANAYGGLNPYGNLDIGSAGANNQSFQGMLNSPDFNHFNAGGQFSQNDVGMMGAGVYNQGNFQGQNMQHMQNMFPAGDMNMGAMDMTGMNHFVGASMGDYMGGAPAMGAAQALPALSAEEMNNAVQDFTQIPGGDAIGDGDAVGTPASTEVKDEGASPAPKPDVKMS